MPEAYWKKHLEKPQPEISWKKYPRLSSPSHLTFFTKGDPKSLLALLQHERPQVIALIMAYMDPQQAAQILEQLPNEKRIPVLEGMANMSRVSPEGYCHCRRGNEEEIRYDHYQ